MNVAMGSNVASKEKCYDPKDATLTFVDGDDDLDFLCNDYKSLRARMSCGHAVTPMSLTDWCRWLLVKGECKFVCGQTGCDVEWPFEEVCKMALLTSKEKNHFKKKLSINAAKNNTKPCPRCKSRVMRTNLSDLCVKCKSCTAVRKRPYKFCWQCMREWKGPAPHSDRCENEGCVDPLLEILRTCPDIIFEDVKEITGCPSIRACPTCGLLIEHDKTQCKNIMCPQCKVEFCFVCLKHTEECLDLSEAQEDLRVYSEELSEDEDETTGKTEDVTKEREDATNESDRLTLGMEVMRHYCMRLTREDEELSEDSDDMNLHYTLCATGVAPRQTSIPVWKKTGNY